MAYAPIAKLDKFTGEEDDTQDTADSWYQSLVNKPQDFNTFKLEFLRCFSNNNSINRLANTFTTIKQKETEADAVTHTRDFESTELKANHAHTINLVMNGSSELDSKLKQFSNSINQKLEGYLADNHAIYQPPQ
ncbi:hypothetical protein G9A89_018488 [Geosiphon pyriformis]|nr:hypothetical protein G9A89_018488 [Geosiphon pyriformis]